MRRSIVQPSLLIAVATVAAIWILAAVGSATAAPSSPHILCSGQGSGQTPCCPLPVAGASRPDLPPVCCETATPCCPNSAAPCCATATCCPPTASGTCCSPAPCPTGSLTIGSAPNPSTAGQKVVISGSMAGASAAGAQVVLWRELAHHSSFQQVAQTTTDSMGHYSFTLRRGTVMADQQWYVTSGGVRSSTVQQHVAAVVALASSTGSAAVGQTIVLRGHVTPSHAGETVLVEMSRGGSWQVIARPRLAAASNYKVSHRFTQSGAARFRVVLRTDARNERSTSRTVKVAVKR